MTEQEKEIIKATADLWNSFIKLPVIHPDDNNDFRFHLHALQNMIFSRSAIINQKDITPE